MSAALSDEQRTWRWRVLFSTFWGYAGYYVSRKVFGLCKTSIAADLGWNLGSTAHIWTTYLVAYMLGQFINSFLGRKYGPRVLLLGGLGISMACNVVFGFSNSFATFLVFMFFNGLAQASGWPGSVGSISEWVRVEERGTVMGIWGTHFMAGNIIVKSTTAFILAYGVLGLAIAGWRLAFFGCTVITFVIWWGLYFWQRNRPEDVGLAPIVDMDAQQDQQAFQANQSRHISLHDYLQLALNPLVLTMGTAYLCTKFLRYAMDSWLPAFLTLQGLNPAESSLLQVFDWGGIAGIIVSGYVLDKFFRGNWAVVSLLMSIGTICAYLSVIYLGTSPYIIAALFGIVGFMVCGPDNLLSGPAAVEVAGARNGVAISGLINGVGSVGPIFQEEIIGYLMRDESTAIRNTNRLTLGISIVMTLLMAFMIWRLRRSHRQEATRIDGLGS